MRQGLFPCPHQINIRAEVFSCSLPFTGIQVGDFKITENGLIDTGQLVDFQPRKLVLDLCEAKEDIFGSGDGTLRQIGGKSRCRTDTYDAGDDLVVRFIGAFHPGKGIRHLGPRPSVRGLFQACVQLGLLSGISVQPFLMCRYETGHTLVQPGLLCP